MADIASVNAPASAHVLAGCAAGPGAPGVGVASPAAGVASPGWAERSLWDSVTFRRFLYAVTLTVALVAGFELFRLGEIAIAGESRVVANSSTEAAMRFVGIAHFLIGFAFLWTSRKMSNFPGRRNIVVGLVVGFGLCAAFAASGGPAAYYPIPMILFYLYFLVHELRDESMFYQTYGEAPPYTGAKPEYLQGVALATAILLVAAMFFWASPFFSVKNSRFLNWLVDIQSLSPVMWAVWWLVPSALFLIGAAACIVWVARNARGADPSRPAASPLAIFQQHKPLWAVYLGIAMVLGAGAFYDGGKLYAIVILHVAAWWIFASIGLAKNGRQGTPAQLGTWTWLRATQPGFQTLHIGLTLAALTAAIVWCYVFNADARHPLGWILDSESFYYWTIMHVTVSFVPKPN